MSIRFWPSTDAFERRVVRAIQSFQATTQPCRSRTTIPTSSPSITSPKSSSATSPNLASILPLDAIDEVVHNILQGRDGGQVHEQGDEARDVAALDGEV